MSSSLAQLKQKQTSAINRLPSTQPEPRCSIRPRRPSLHKLESDEYEAESQRTSRAATPSASKSKPKSKNSNSNGEKGNRPGRIVQPVDAWATRKSPEPLVQPGSPSDDFDMEGENPQVETISKSEAIARVSARLGYDASGMPDDVIQDVLEDIEVLKAEADCSRPMEIEDGASQALRQSPNPMGRGSQGLAREAPDDINESEELPQQLAYPGTPLPLGQTSSKTAPNDDIATEYSDEAELGPGDSVSQRVPQETKNSPPEPLRRALPQPDLARDHVHNTKRSSNDTAEELDDPPIPTKRRRAVLSPPPRLVRSPPAPLAHTRARAPGLAVDDPLPSILRTSRPTTAPHGRIIFLTAPKSSSATSSSLSSAPPISDVDAVLTWATRVVTKATHSSNGDSVSHQAGQIDPIDNHGPYAHVASILENLRAHLASRPKPQANKAQYLRNRRDTDFVKDDAEILEAEAALALGKRINVPRKPCLSDFPGFRRHIASNAIPDLVATLITQGAYEVYGTVSLFAKQSYGRQWTNEIPDEQFQPAPRALLGIMVHRGSCFRSNTMDRIRPEVCHLWPFIRTPHTADDLLYNKRLATRLLPNQFHCRNTKTGEDPYEHPSLQACINTALFWSPESIGASFEERFRPLPLPSVAFVLTKMQHGIEEMSTGRYVKNKLNVDQQRKSYEAHMLGLVQYDKKAPERLLGFQEKWFKAGMAYSGAHFTPEVAPYQAITRDDQIREDTPVRDQTDEDTPVRDRIRQAFVKAKTRVVY